MNQSKAPQGTVTDSDFDSIRRGFAKAAHLAVEHMKKEGIDPRTVEVDLPIEAIAKLTAAAAAEAETVTVELAREDIAKLAALAAAEGETLNEFVVRSIGDILDAEGITTEATR